jgi:DNA-binding transcriptional LysR family regulator
LLPLPGDLSPARAWRSAVAELEARALDVAIVPTDEIPPRFRAHALYREDFVVAVRTGHPFVKDPTLKRYCDTHHLVVSLAGDPYGFVDEVLAKRGLARRIVLTVPSFLFALAVVADTDLVGTLPRRFVATHGRRFGVVGLDPPLEMRTFRLNAVASKAAMNDTGLVWLFDGLRRVHDGSPTRARTRGK